MTASGNGSERPQQVVVVGPDGQPVGALPMPQGMEDDGSEGGLNVSEMVEQPAKVMRIGSMVKQLLEEVRRRALPGGQQPGGQQPDFRPGGGQYL